MRALVGVCVTKELVKHSNTKGFATTNLDPNLCIKHNNYCKMLAIAKGQVWNCPEPMTPGTRQASMPCLSACMLACLTACLPACLLACLLCIPVCPPSNAFACWPGRR